MQRATRVVRSTPGRFQKDERVISDDMLEGLNMVRFGLRVSPNAWDGSAGMFLPANLISGLHILRLNTSTQH